MARASFVPESGALMQSNTSRMKRDRSRKSNGTVKEVVITDILGDIEARIKNRHAAIRYIAQAYCEDGETAFHTTTVARLQDAFGARIVSSAIRYLNQNGARVPKYVTK
jgi:hypothetical protein